MLKPFSTYHPDQYLEAITQVLTKYPQVRVNFDGIRISNRDGMFPSSLMIKVINSSDLYVLRRELLKVAPNTSKRPYRAHLTLGHAEKLEKTSVYRYFSEQQLVRTSLNAVPVLYHKRGCELQQIEAA